MKNSANHAVSPDAQEPIAFKRQVDVEEDIVSSVLAGERRADGHTPAE